MKPFILLLVVFGLTAGVSRVAAGDWKIIFSANLAMCLMLCFTALGHFKFTQGMSMMLPESIPNRAALVILTGGLEILLGVCLLFPALRPAAGICLVIFLILILPGNIYAAMHHVNYEKGNYEGPGPSYLWFRVPLQLFFIAWTYFFSISRILL